MTTGTVLVLPDEDPHLEPLRDAVLHGGLGARLVVPVDGPDAALTARVCAAINSSRPEPPVVVVAPGTSALMLPAVALSQRAVRRRIGEYLLIEPVLPPVTDSWPDAPVTVVVASADADVAVQSRLRGWTVIRPDELAGWAPVG